MRLAIKQDFGSSTPRGMLTRRSLPCMSLFKSKANRDLTGIFFSGFGFFCTIFLLFSALLAWQLSAIPLELLQRLKLLRWAFAACFSVLTVLTWYYIFPLPVIFSVLTTLALILAAWQADKAKV